MKRAGIIGLLFSLPLAGQIRFPPVRTVATLGACVNASPKVVAVTDGSTSTDCSVGSGTFDVVCYCLDGAWAAAASGGGVGTVTSVGAAVPSEFSVSGSPITSSGTITITEANQAANTVYAGPTSGASAAPGFRALVSGDIPALAYLSSATNYAASSSSAGPATSVADGSIVNSSVASGAAIAESKLNLDFATHSNVNDPTAGQKAALAGSSGTPGVGNPYITEADSRNVNARTPTAHHASHEPGGSDPLGVDALAAVGSLRTLGSGAQQAAAGNDSRLSDARAPLSHVHAAADTTSGVFDVTRLATGTPTASTFVAGDGTWKIPSSGANPGGSGSEIQFRSGPTSLGAVTGSSVSGANITLVGTLGGITQLNAGNLQASGNTLAATNTNGSVAITPNGTGLLQIGGTSATYPALVNTTVFGSGTLDIRQADNSGMGTLVASTIATVSSIGGVGRLKLTSNGEAILRSSGRVWFTDGSDTNGTTDAGLGRVSTGVIAAYGASGLGWQQWAGECYVASDQTNATTSPASSTCSITVKNGRRYGGTCTFYVSDSVAAEGVAVDFDGGTATASSFRSHCTGFDSGLALSSQTTALATDVATGTFTGSGAIECRISFEPSSNGTFLPRFMQASHSSGTLTLFRGSNCYLFDMP